WRVNATSNMWAEKGEPMPWGPTIKPEVMLGATRPTVTMHLPTFFYNAVYDKKELKSVSTANPVIGIFMKGHMDTWYEREFNSDVL
ncbi:hypothetical protein HDU98_001482, partial [Podochytrium sp. JEL0797]